MNKFGLFGPPNQNGRFFKLFKGRPLFISFVASGGSLKNGPNFWGGWAMNMAETLKKIIQKIIQMFTQEILSLPETEDFKLQLLNELRSVLRMEEHRISSIIRDHFFAKAPPEFPY